MYSHSSDTVEGQKARAVSDCNLEQDAGSGFGVCEGGGHSGGRGEMLQGRGQEEEAGRGRGESEGAAARRKEADGVPDEFVCPISMELMMEPVLAAGESERVWGDLACSSGRTSLENQIDSWRERARGAVKRTQERTFCGH